MFLIHYLFRFLHWVSEFPERLLRRQPEDSDDFDDQEMERTAARAERRMENRGWLFYWLTRPFFWISDRLDQLGRDSARAITIQEDEDIDQEVDRHLSKQLRKQARQQAIHQSWIAGLGRVVIWPFALVFGFAWSLVSTRSAHRVMTPLMIVIVIGMLAGGYFLLTSDPNKVARRYEAAVARALKEGDTQAADLYRQKLEQLGMKTVNSDFRRALYLEEQGDFDGALEIMESLTTGEETGLAAAHHWVVSRWLQGKIESQQINWESEIDQHLDALSEMTRGSKEVEFLRGTSSAKFGHPESAIESLKLVADDLPEAAYLLLDLQIKAGDKTGAEEAAQLVVQSRPNDDENESYYLSNFRAHGILNQEQRQKEVLYKWLAAHPESQLAVALSATKQLGEFDDWIKSPTASEIPRFVRLFSQLDSIPEADFDKVRARLAALWMNQKQPVVETMIQQLTTPDNSTPLVLEFFGSAHASQKNWGEARRLLESAIRMKPGYGIAQNNLAYVLFHGFPEEQTQALKHADLALQTDPTNASFRETRGQIRLKLRDWEGAIEDLKIAISGLGDRADLHLSIAQAYQAIGDSQTAQRHRNAAR